MIGLGANGRLQIETQGDGLSHVYNLKAMVRVLGMAMGSEAVDEEDIGLMRTYCHLLEEMLPGEGQLVVSPIPTFPKGEGDEAANVAPNMSR